MSLIRRVKSFSIKKYRSTDELKSIEEDGNVPRTQGHSRARKKGHLNREKSLSMEFVPLRIDLENNDLFNRQRNKLEAQDRINNTSPLINKQRRNVRRAESKQVKILERRQSRSLDDVGFFQCISGNSKDVYPHSVQLRKNNLHSTGGNHLRLPRYNTVDVTRKQSVMNYTVEEKNVKYPPKTAIEVVNIKYNDNADEIHLKTVQPKTSTNLVKSKSEWYINELKDDDLISEFGDESKQPVDDCKKPGNFPVDEEDGGVQIRPRGSKLERPKTYTSPVTKKKDDPFDFRVPCRLEIGNEQCVKIKKKETLRLNNGRLQVLDERGNEKMTLKKNVNLKKGTKMINKTEVEMMDVDKTIYRFHFDSAKETKLFTDMEKSRLPSFKDKNTGPFSLTQFLKLWKKRSSRDLLESKGIIRNEPIFGNTLEELWNLSNSVPEVITRIVRLIEAPLNITSVGLYRASANLAVVQNIRCEINCGRWEILDKYKAEVDVLAVTLKLFFRELKEPLIPYEIYQRLHTAITKSSSAQEHEEIADIVDSLPEANRATLLYIIRHLLKVSSYQTDNKMDFHNISICWGPSLITLPDNCTDLVTQTTEFTNITKHLLIYYCEFFRNEIDNDPPPKIDFVYEVVQKLIELIESNLDMEGIYRKSGSTNKIDKIMKQLAAKRLNDLGTSKNDVHDLCCALKKFLSSLKEPLIPKDLFDHYCEICDRSDEHSLRVQMRNAIENIPRKEALLRLLEHLRNVIRHEKKNKMSMMAMTHIWTTTLMVNPVVQGHRKESQKIPEFFRILLYLNEPVLPDLLQESELTRTRESKYDNVPDDITNEVETKL